MASRFPSSTTTRPTSRARLGNGRGGATVGGAPLRRQARLFIAGELRARWGRLTTPAMSLPAPPLPSPFRLQPVRETRDRQLQLWKDLIVAYCRHHKVGGRGRTIWPPSRSPACHLSVSSPAPSGSTAACRRERASSRASDPVSGRPASRAPDVRARRRRFSAVCQCGGERPSLFSYTSLDLVPPGSPLAKQVAAAAVPSV